MYMQIKYVYAHYVIGFFILELIKINVQLY